MRADGLNFQLNPQISSCRQAILLSILYSNLTRFKRFQKGGNTLDRTNHNSFLNPFLGLLKGNYFLFYLLLICFRSML